MDRDSLRQQIGRLLMVGIPGSALDAATGRILEELRVGGVILFRRNVDGPEQIAALSAALHALPSRPLVAIDHEGGRVMRLSEPFTHFPPAVMIGHTGDVNLAYDVGRAMAMELASVGIDLDFAPVLDVHSNPANPVIGDRAFGSDPAVVGAMGIALMRGLHAGGLIACGKHFPGHGDTATDSHFELPVVHRSRADLERIELAPFRAAINAGLELLMTAHVVYPALDLAHPATLSRAILFDLLREEMGFTGVVASDDLDMRAIAAHHDVGAAAVATLQAGADLLLVCQELDHAVLACTAVERAIDAGALDPRIITAASDRVKMLREHRSSRGPITCPLPNPDHRTLAVQIASA